jgi:citrate lyase beta subunit
MTQMKVDFPLGDRLRRSVLITPGNDMPMLAKSAACASDVSILDLEDGVHDDKKEDARACARAALRDLDWHGKERVVRTNSVLTRDGIEDLRAAVEGGADSVLLAKVRTAAEIVTAAGLLQDFEETAGRTTPVRIWSMIESASALQDVDAIAKASPRMTALLFGGGDLGADLGLKRTQLGTERTLGPVRYEYIYGYSRTITAARVARLDPINMGFTSVHDLEGTRSDAEFSAQFGFSGTLVLSPRQIPVVHEVFSPSETDLSWAREILGDFQTATESNRTVIVVNDEMADGPYVRNASRIVALDALVRASRG